MGAEHGFLKFLLAIKKISTIGFVILGCVSKMKILERFNYNLYLTFHAQVGDLKKKLDAQNREEMKSLAKKHKDKAELNRIKREAQTKHIQMAVQERQKVFFMKSYLHGKYFVSILTTLLFLSTLSFSLTASRHTGEKERRSESPT